MAWLAIYSRRDLWNSNIISVVAWKWCLAWCRDWPFFQGENQTKTKLTDFHICNSVSLTLSSPGGKWGGGGVIFVGGKFRFKLFLNDLWYEPETFWLFLTFTKDYFDGKKFQKITKLPGGNMFLYHGYFQKIEVRMCRNSFSCKIKYLHV